jgi:hypothetical protein
MSRTPAQKFADVSFIIDTEAGICELAKQLHFNKGLSLGEYCEKAELIKRGIDLVIETKLRLKED